MSQKYITANNELIEKKGAKILNRYMVSIKKKKIIELMEKLELDIEKINSTVSKKLEEYKRKFAEKKTSIDDLRNIMADIKRLIDKKMKITISLENLGKIKPYDQYFERDLH